MQVVINPGTPDWLAILQAASQVLAVLIAGWAALEAKRAAEAGAASAKIASEVAQRQASPLLVCEPNFSQVACVWQNQAHPSDLIFAGSESWFAIKISNLGEGYAHASSVKLWLADGKVPNGFMHLASDNSKMILGRTGDQFLWDSIFNNPSHSLPLGQSLSVNIPPPFGRKESEALVDLPVEMTNLLAAAALLVALPGPEGAEEDPRNLAALPELRARAYWRDEDGGEHPSFEHRFAFTIEEAIAHGPDHEISLYELENTPSITSIRVVLRLRTLPPLAPGE